MKRQSRGSIACARTTDIEADLGTGVFVNHSMENVGPYLDDAPILIPLSVITTRSSTCLSIRILDSMMESR